MEDKRAQLINEIIFLNDRMDELWQYHPENPSRRDIVWEYSDLQRRVNEVEAELDQLGSEEA